ncbi:MAG: hypothetical protein V1705_02750, partial [bacterium]
MKNFSVFLLAFLGLILVSADRAISQEPQAVDLVIENTGPGGNVDVGEFRLRPDRLFMRVRNQGREIITNPVEIGFQWINSSNEAVGSGASFTFDQDLATSRIVVPAGTSRVFDGASYDFDSNQVPAIDRYIENKPSQAARLRIALDPNNLILEMDERNNALTAAPTPVVDLEVVSARIALTPYYQLIVTARNNSQTSVPSIAGNDLTLYWTDEAGQPIFGSIIARRGMSAFTAGETREIVFTYF